MLTLQISTIFLASILLTVAQVVDEFITVVKNDRKKSLFWGFLSWVLTGTIIVNIDGPVLFKVISILFAGVGAAIGNLLGIELIRILKKQKKKGLPFFVILKQELRKGALFKFIRKTAIYKKARKKLHHRKRVLSHQTEAILLGRFF
ncbi:MAG: hypothetical protein AB1633_08330 [Elusimicrobiota bacterium]